MVVVAGRPQAMRCPADRPPSESTKHAEPPRETGSSATARPRRPPTRGSLRGRLRRRKTASNMAGPTGRRAGRRLPSSEGAACGHCDERRLAARRRQLAVVETLCRPIHTRRLGFPSNPRARRLPRPSSSHRVAQEWQALTRLLRPPGTLRPPPTKYGGPCYSTLRPSVRGDESTAGFQARRGARCAPLPSQVPVAWSCG